MSTNNALNVNSSTPLSPEDGGTGVNNTTHTLTVSANSSINQNVTTIGNPTFQGVISGASAGIANNYFQSLSPTSGQGYMLVRSPDNSGARINTLTNIATTGNRTWSLPDASGTVALTGDLSNYATKIEVQQSSYNIGIDTGIADAYVVDLGPAVTSLTDGLIVTFVALNTNATLTPTINVNSLGDIQVSGNFLSGIFPGDFSTISLNVVQYCASQSVFFLLNGGANTFNVNALQNALYTTGNDTGTLNAIFYVPNYDNDNYSPGIGSQISFLPKFANTSSSPTITIGSLGSPTAIILMSGETIPAGALSTTKQAVFIYGVNTVGTLGWILMNPQNLSTYSSRYGGFIPVSVSGTSQTMVSGRAYIFNNTAATTGTLPTSASSIIGDTIKIKGRSNAAWIIRANTSQVIKLGSVSSSAAGTATSALGSDSIQLVYVASNEWSIDWALSSAIVLA